MKTQRGLDTDTEEPLQPVSPAPLDVHTCPCLLVQRVQVQAEKCIMQYDPAFACSLIAKSAAESKIENKSIISCAEQVRGRHHNA